nr:ribosome biogenesis GTP-binding protein YihA/YsxC [Candidatus Syntrophocurvum alkaliphilum]
MKTAELAGIFVDIKSLPEEDMPEIALVGRSNVGKSSLINKVVNRKNLAKSSSTPGKTRTINYYIINNEFYFVDLPGYGYAKVSKTEKAKWKKMIEKYLSQRKQLKGVIQLIDIRHPPSEDDILMQEWLLHFGLPVLVVVTKADKISKGARLKHLKPIKLNLNLDFEPICFSAQNGEGVSEVKEAISEIIG